MFSKTFYRTGVAVVVVLAFFIIPSLFAADKTLTRLKGEISGIDATNQLVLISSKSGVAEVRMDSVTRISREKNPIFFSDLRIGDKISVRYDANTLLAESASVKYPVLTGLVTVLKTGPIQLPGRLSIQTESEKIVTFLVPHTTKIEKDGKQGRLEDLVEGDFAKVMYDSNSMVALAIHAFSVPTSSSLNEGLTQYLGLSGIITGLNSGAIELPNRLTITTDNGKVVTFAVTNSAKIEKGGKQINFRGLALGDFVKLLYDPKTMVAVSIRARESTQFDDNQYITVRVIFDRVEVVGDLLMFTVLHMSNQSGFKEKVMVGRDAEVYLNNRQINPSELKQGDTAIVTYDLSTKIAVKVDARR